MRAKLWTPTILSLLLFVAAGNAFGQFDESAWYRITAKHSGRCLAVAGGIGSLGNGVPVIQWDCIEAETNQKWQVIPVDDGYYKIIAQHSGKALDVFGGVISQRNGAVVQQRDYNGGDNQKWQITCAGDGFYKIAAKHSGKALDIDYNGEPGALGNGPFAQQWDDWGGDNQKFWFQPLSPGLPYGRPTPATCPSEADARLRVNLYTADSRIYPRTRQFRLDQPIVLKVENNTGAPIYLKQGNRPERLIREEGLQVERLDGSNWFPVLPSGQCEPSYVETHNGDGTVTRTHIDAAPVTQLIELRATMNITRLWTAPAALGPGIYRLSLTYYRSDARSSPPSFICSSTFEVARR